MQSVETEGAGEALEVDEPEASEGLDRTSLASRIVWGLVIFMAAAVLLGVVTLVSVALLSPDAFEGACKRPQLVRPEACSPVGRFGG
jgi:hypothetical protein